MRLVGIPALLLVGCAPAATAQADPASAPFRSVALSDGGHVLIRHGDVHRVTLVEGRADIRVEGTRLRIGRCRDCPGRNSPTVEIVTPRLDALAVDDGGRLVLEGGFPSQASLAVSVSNGGAIDARPLGADRVTASVSEGGAVFVRPARQLDAAISQGGVITYWGDPQVAEAVQGGGAVRRGRPADADRPIADTVPQPVHPLRR
jgi:hypothetical protein